jgi:signal transduction histidine kinase
MAKRLPRRATLLKADIARTAERLASAAPRSMTDEMVQQNHELLAALEELRVRQEELTRLNEELEHTNRGVLALYAELDETAEHLRRADQMKSKFLSNMTHEFQTPLNSILALTRLLLERADGDLSPEQERQVNYIRSAARDLSELVHDLLDIAKVEAGKVTVRPTAFAVAELFGALRGLMRPLQTNDAVALVFDSPEELTSLFTDEAKISQILRNYISNALKFTERPSAGKCSSAPSRTSRATSRSVSRIRASASPRRIRDASFRSSARCRTRCRAVCVAPGWDCRCRSGSRNCSAALSASRARPARARRSGCACRSSHPVSNRLPRHLHPTRPRRHRVRAVPLCWSSMTSSRRVTCCADV